MLVAFPIVLFIMTLIADVVYEAGWAGSDWSQFAYILLVGGVAAAVAAAISGLVGYSIIVYRGRAKGNHYWRNGWILSLVSVVLLAVSGWLGQDLVYKHGMGFVWTGVPIAAERQRLVPA
ncbi:hypothetical protein NSK_000193 [Nannochloropsis salina CCMP1776]|uniref:DUF2231 domain-containing protein n=1 Tax=Nannochloropsis salina CCMP1776 TaxID=1027361 RepID=A0A4D9DC56_9STRA|nr:hypothetical protein NSK_000193 [Nannochloropsis salina CCMP1776]|eukprot:TFJ88624.1 hypothetical protein NSK_000193 [Nannochloropsis salina CCMP1776]